MLAGQGQAPLRSHDLVFLLDQCTVDMPEHHAEFLEMLNEVSVPTRYPDELDRMIDQYPLKRAAEILKRCREVYAWLKNCS